MPGPSRLIQPLISTEAQSTLKSLVPARDFHDGMGLVCGLPSRAIGLQRIRQVFITALPLIFADVLGLMACYLTAFLSVGWLAESYYYPGLWNNLAALCFCHLLVGSFLGLFPASGMNPVCELRTQLTSVGGSFILLVALNGIVGEVAVTELATMLLAIPLAILVLPVSRFCTRKIVGAQSWWGEKVIVLGSSQQATLVHSFLLSNPQRGLKPLGIMTCTPDEYWQISDEHSAEFLGTASQLIPACRKYNCHWVIAAVADSSDDQIKELLAYGSMIPNFVVLTSNIMLPTLWVNSFDAAGLVGVHIRDRMLYPLNRLTKRVFDLAITSVLLLLVLPILFVAAVWIKWSSPGPVFFKHHGRIGRNGKTFGAWKIRTMAVNADQLLKEHLESDPDARAEWNRDLKLKNDPRIIPGIGKFLRRTSLDELPQLFNVLVGDMSLVGPRPIYTTLEVEKFQEMYSLYVWVRPGLTGLWQVSGRNNTSYDDRVRLDTYYVRNWSLWLDYFILLRTVRTVLLREGSY